MQNIIIDRTTDGILGPFLNYPIMKFNHDFLFGKIIKCNRKLVISNINKEETYFIYID